MQPDEDTPIPFTGHFIIAGDGHTARKRNRYNPTHDEITKHFNVSQTEAAKLLNISRSKLKMLCRQYGVKNWPYRQLKRKELEDSGALLYQTTVSEIASTEKELLQVGGIRIEHTESIKFESNTLNVVLPPIHALFKISEHHYHQPAYIPPPETQGDDNSRRQ